MHATQDPCDPVNAQGQVYEVPVWEESTGESTEGKGGVHADFMNVACDTVLFDCTQNIKEVPAR